MIGYLKEEVIGENISLLRSARHDALFYQIIDDSLAQIGTWQGEIWSRGKDGGVFSEWLSVHVILDSRNHVKNYVWVFSDSNAPRELQKKILELSFYDSLTRLPNRRLLLDRLEQARASSARTGQFGALLLLDLDHFQKLNDTQGHDAGDQLLVEVARRLRINLRRNDTAAHLGGDEFMVLLEDLSTEEMFAASTSETIAEKLRATLAKTWVFREVSYYPTASIGVTLFANHREETEILLTQTDLALKQAKAAGRNTIRFFSQVLQSTINTCVKMELEMRLALEKGEFLLFYQPQVDNTRRITGAEALIRWQPPGTKMVSPAVFIPVAEQTGLIVPIGYWVLETACQQLVEWSKDPEARHLKLAVNISACQFRQRDFVAQVQKILEKSRAPANHLKLELTESVVVDDIEQIIGSMKLLQELGIEFSLDDFGTGYSSLTYLKRLPFEQVKIDQGFIRGIPTDIDNCAIARAVLALGKSLHLNVIAEGVETEEQREYLSQKDCDGYQGYLFGKPGPADVITALVRGSPK
ncbi:diguanylate cyclase [Gammaproteobacteria bacterium]